jgi:hypothetical protein
MNIRSTGLGDDADDLGGYSIDQFGELLGGVSRGLIYKEVRAGRLILTKMGARSIITKKHGKQYLRAREREAEAKVAP